MDVPLGCCGFVNGMSIAASMLSHGGLKRGLMINAETNSTNRNKGIELFVLCLLMLQQ